ncbi:hypothetical protein ACIBP6_40340 [Nonomuraea terrae]|uniref:hypothetical protein n=1 Tax=Nonomuraea terrae TaxID=2530383 RepID=UPI00378A1CD6
MPRRPVRRRQACQGQAGLLLAVRVGELTLSAQAGEAGGEFEALGDPGRQRSEHVARIGAHLDQLPGEPRQIPP